MRGTYLDIWSVATLVDMHTLPWSKANEKALQEMEYSHVPQPEESEESEAGETDPEIEVERAANPPAPEAWTCHLRRL
jgi:hypothetical protein